MGAKARENQPHFAVRNGFCEEQNRSQCASERASEGAETKKNKAAETAGRGFNRGRILTALTKHNQLMENMLRDKHKTQTSSCIRLLPAL
ncbi:MAG: hypothetical protein ACAI35_21640 [Candidatus Methylacidiphilales bacterium]